MMQKAERAVTLYDEFRNSTIYVPTAPFMEYPGNDTYNGDYHYFGRADVYYHIGRAFGYGMLNLMGANDLSMKPFLSSHSFEKEKEQRGSRPLWSAFS